MGVLNYTPIKTQKESITYGRKEAEPKSLIEINPKVDHQKLESEPVIENTATKEPQIEVIPELPELDDELRDEGVELVDHDTIFVENRKIDLPIPLEKVNQGLSKPLSSGWRWLSELTRYILARFHIVIKKTGDKFKLVEQH